MKRNKIALVIALAVLLVAIAILIAHSQSKPAPTPASTMQADIPSMGLPVATETESPQRDAEVQSADCYEWEIDSATDDYLAFSLKGSNGLASYILELAQMSWRQYGFLAGQNIVSRTIIGEEATLPTGYAANIDSEGVFHLVTPDGKSFTGDCSDHTNR